MFSYDYYSIMVNFGFCISPVALSKCNYGTAVNEQMICGQASWWRRSGGED